MDMYQYRYLPRNVVITMNHHDYEFTDGRVIYYSIGHDFIHRRMPIIFMQMEMDDEMIGLIYDNIEEASFKFDIIEQQLDPTGEMILNTSLYLRHSFSIIPRNDQNAYITSQDSFTKENMDQMRNPQIFEFYLVDKAAITWFTQEITGVFQGSSRPDILQALFTMRNIPANIVIATPPVNIDPVEYVILPLGDLVGNIDTLNKAYGLYESYPIIYYDMEYLYCINKVKPNVTIRSASDFGTVTMIMKNPNSPESRITGSYTDYTAKTHYINLNQVPTILDQTIQDGSTKFATLTTINSDGTVQKETIDNEATKLQYAYAFNELTMDQLINETLTGHSVNIVTENCCISCLRPWKSFNFDVDTMYMDLGLTGHDYRLINWKMEGRREGATSFLHTLTMTVVKPTRN